jgi:hypothetical protein
VYTLPIPLLLVDLARQEGLPLEQFIQVDNHCDTVTSNADRTLFHVRCDQIPSRVAIPGFGAFSLPLSQGAGKGLRFTLPIQGQGGYWLSGKRIGPGQLSLPVEAVGKSLCFTNDQVAKPCIERIITLRAILEQRPLHLDNGS